MDSDSFEELLRKLSQRHFNEVAELQRQVRRQVTSTSRSRVDKDLEAGAPAPEGRLSEATVAPAGLRDVFENRPEASFIYDLASWWDILASYKEPERSGRVFNVLQSSWFHAFSMLVIVANLIWMTWQTDWNISHYREDDPLAFLAVDYSFTAFFLVEVILGLAVHRLYYFINADGRWNVLDFSLVMLSLMELCFSWANLTGGSIMYLRVVRLCKLARALRSLKVIASFRELAQMAYSFSSCFHTVFWSMVLLLIVIFLSALVFSNGVVVGLRSAHESGLDPEAEKDVLDNFGSVGRTTLSLYMAVTGGDDWANYYNALEALGGIYHYLFLVYTIIFSTSVLNILTGVYVEKAVAAALPDRDERILEERQNLWDQASKFKEMFQTMDLDSSGRISFTEFEKCMDDPNMVAYLSSVNVSIWDVSHFFRMLSDEDGFVNIERFVHGCMSMKGSATALDMQKQLYHIQELEQILRQWERSHWPQLLAPVPLMVRDAVTEVPLVVKDTTVYKKSL